MKPYELKFKLIEFLRLSETSSCLAEIVRMSPCVQFAAVGF